MPSPAETILSLEVGQCVLLDSPLAVDVEEKLELWVMKVREENGLREFEVRQHGVLLRRLAAKPNKKDGSVTWARL